MTDSKVVSDDFLNEEDGEASGLGMGSPDPESNPNFGKVFIDPTWSPIRISVARLLTHPCGDVIVCLAVLIQFWLVVSETNRRATGGDESIMELPSKFIIALFCIEVAMRVYAFRADYIKDTWNLFDACLVFLDISFEILSVVVGNIPSITPLRIVKLVRIARFARVVRTVHLFRELYMMLHGFVSAMRAILWATVLLFFMLTVWGVVAVEFLHPINQEVYQDGTYRDCERCPRAFQTVQDAVLTFMQQIVAGDSWGLVSIPIMEKSPWSAFVFMAVLVSVELGVLNLILTVIVDRAAQARQEDKRFVLQERAEEIETAKRELKALCVRLDSDGNGTLSKEELLDGFDNQPEFKDAMRLMDVQREDLTSLFTILDEDGSGDVAYNEFVDQLHKMKSQDVQMILVFIWSYLKSVRKLMNDEIAMTGSILDDQRIVQEALGVRVAPLTPNKALVGSPQEVGEILAEPGMTALPTSIPKNSTDESASNVIPKVATFDKDLKKELLELRHQISADILKASANLEATFVRLLGESKTFAAAPPSFTKLGAHTTVTSEARDESVVKQPSSGRPGLRLPQSPLHSSSVPIDIVANPNALNPTPVLRVGSRGNDGCCAPCTKERVVAIP